MSNPVELTVRVSSDVTDAAAGFDQVGSAARTMAADVDAAGASASTASDRMSGLGDTTDDVASKTGVMTGAMGALAGGLEAVGLGKYAAALEGTAIATDFVSGASDLFTLALQSEKVQAVLSTAAMIGHKVALVASTVATNAMAIAQRALNLAMSANPIMLVVTALTLIVGGLILAYQKSETFRGIVDALGTVAKEVFENVTGWIGDVVSAIQDIVDKMTTAGIAGLFSAAFAPIETAIGWVQDLIDWIGRIDFPDMPDFNPFRTTQAAGTNPFPTTTTTPAGPSTVVNVTVQGAIDPVTTARQVLAILQQYGALSGPVTWGEVTV